MPDEELAESFCGELRGLFDKYRATMHLDAPANIEIILDCRDGIIIIDLLTYDENETKILH